MNNNEDQNNLQRANNLPGSPVRDAAPLADADFVTPEVTRRDPNRTPPRAPRAERQAQNSNAENFNIVPRRIDFTNDAGDVFDYHHHDELLTEFHRRQRGVAMAATQRMQAPRTHGEILAARAHMTPCRYDSTLTGFEYFRDDRDPDDQDPDDQSNHNFFKRPRLNF